MKIKSLVAAALLAAFVAAPAGNALAQGPAARIAVAKPGRIFLEMQETQDLRASLESEGVRLKSEEEKRRAALQQLQNQRNQLKADSPQWDDLNNKLMDEALGFQLWGQQTKAKAERNQKRQLKQLFERIEKAVGEVAQRDGYDLVLADQHPELPDNLDQINIDQLRALINSRNVLYTSPKVDISDAIIAHLDGQYKARGGAAPSAAPPPAAAPAGGAAAPAPRQPAAPPAGQKPAAPAPKQ